MFGGTLAWLVRASLTTAAIQPVGQVDEPATELPLSEIITLPADDPCLAQGIADNVAAHLGRTTVASDLAVEVTASGNTVGFQMRRGGEVRAEKSDWPLPARCADRRAALGLAVAIALDAAVLESLTPIAVEPTEPEPASKPPPPALTTTSSEPPEPAPSPTPAEPEPIPEPRHTFGLTVAGGPLLVFGVLPRIAFGGELGFDLGVASWLDVKIDGGGAMALRTPLGAGEIDSSIGWGGLHLCPGRGLGRVRVRICAGVAAGAMRASGRGFDRSLQVTLPWVAIRTGADLDVRLVPRVALRVGGGLLTPLVRDTLSVRDEADGLVERRDPAPAGAQVGVAVVVHLLGR